MPTYVFDTNPDGSYKIPRRMVLKSEREGPPPGAGQRIGDREPPMVMGDIQPYKSTIDGSEITSRNKHRKHLREHGCVEIGTENLHTATKMIEKNRPGHDSNAVKRAVIDAYEKVQSNAS